MPSAARARCGSSRATQARQARRSAEAGRRPHHDPTHLPRPHVPQCGQKISSVLEYSPHSPHKAVPSTSSRRHPGRRGILLALLVLVARPQTHSCVVVVRREAESAAASLQASVACTSLPGIRSIRYIHLCRKTNNHARTREAGEEAGHSQHTSFVRCSRSHAARWRRVDGLRLSGAGLDAPCQYKLLWRPRCHRDNRRQHIHLHWIDGGGRPRRRRLVEVHATLRAARRLHRIHDASKVGTASLLASQRCCPDRL